MLGQMGRHVENGGWKEESGASMVEFAIVLLPLLILLFGIIEFSLILYDKAILVNASREGARVASLRGRSEAEIRAVVRNRVGNSLVTFGSDVFGDNPNDITIDRTIDSVDYVRIVTVRYTYDSLLLPGISDGFDGSVDLSATTVMRDENQSPSP